MQEDLDECCNPGTYGKALVDYLQSNLEARGYEIAFSVAEDFGWWIEIKTQLSVPSHIALRRSHEGPGVADFGVSVDDSPRRWSWRQFRFVDLSVYQEKLADDVRKILTSDPDIEFVADHFDDYPDHRIQNEGESGPRD